MRCGAVSALPRWLHFCGRSIAVGADELAANSATGLPRVGHRRWQTCKKRSGGRPASRKCRPKTAGYRLPNSFGFAFPAKPPPEPPPARLFRCCFLGGNSLGRPRADDSAEFLKELAGELFRGGVDEPSAKLGELAANVGFGLVLQECTGAVVDKAHRGAAFRKSGHPAAAFAGNPVAVGWIEIR